MPILPGNSCELLSEACSAHVYNILSVVTCTQAPPPKKTDKGIYYDISIQDRLFHAPWKSGYLIDDKMLRTPEKDCNKIIRISSAVRIQ